MRRYYLASVENRGKVDLKAYQDKIIDAVHQIMPQAQVTVEKDYYTVDPTPVKGDAIRIGRLLSNGKILGGYCIKISKLFCSEEVEKGSVLVNGRKKKRTGGHQ